MIKDLLALLELEQLEVNLFRGASRDIGSAQVFGGQVLGQGPHRRLAHSRRSRGAFAPRVLPEARGFQRAHHL